MKRPNRHKLPLDLCAARTDLTDRECAKLIGGLIGVLCQMADVETVRRSVVWWAETEEAWKFMQAVETAAATDELARSFIERMKQEH